MVGTGGVVKGGVVRDPQLRREAVTQVVEAARGLGFAPAGTVESPVAGAKKGNVEYLVYLKRGNL